MRLFRAKVADENEWVYGYLTNEKSIFQEKEHSGSKNCGVGVFAINKKTICEDTGLVDIHDNKVYSGDILYDNDTDNYYYVYYDDSFGVYVADFGFDTQLLGGIINVSEIAGNIWDSEVMYMEILKKSENQHPYFTESIEKDSYTGPKYDKGKIIEISEDDLFELYIDRDMDSCLSFDEYKYAFINQGCKVLEGNGCKK